MGNTTNVTISYDVLDGSSSEFNKMAGEFTATTLSNTASETTIVANGNIDSYFTMDQGWFAKMGLLIDNEANNINNLGISFSEYDELLSQISD